jgi:O-antigen/teichoic acid export membrane protein
MQLKDTIAKLKQFSFFDTFKHASTYFSGTMLVHALGLLTLPIFTELLTTEEYGIINVFTTYVSVVAVLLSVNLHWAISRYYFEEDKKDFDSFLGSIFIAVTITFWTIGSVLLYFKEPIAAYINVPSTLVFFAMATAYLMIVYSFFDQIMIAKKESKKYIKVQVVWQYLKFACAVAGMLYLVDVFYWEGQEESSYTFMGKITGDFIATCAIVLYTSYQVYKYMSFKNLSFGHVKYALVYSLPLIPFALSNYILTSFDQWYIAAAVGQAEAGEYAFAYKIGMLYLGLGVALLNGAQPAYFKCMNENKHKEVWQQVDSMTKLLALGGGFLILFAVDAGTLLASNDVFLEALPMAPVIVGGYVFHGISSFYNRGIYYEKKNIYLAMIILTSGIINIFLNRHYIGIYGYQAAAYTTLLSYFVMMVLSIIVTTFILKLPPLPLGRIIKYIVLLGAVVGINYIVGEPNIGMHIGWIAFKMLLFAILGLVLFYNKIGLLLK